MWQKLLLSIVVVLLSANLGQAGNLQTQAKKSQPPPTTKPVSKDKQPNPKVAPVERPESKEASTLPHLALSARIVEVLRAIATESADWENKASAAKTQAEVADLTWDFAPPIARIYLTQAWETASKLKEVKTSISAFRNISSRAETQRAVLLIARKRDQPLAEQWLEALADEAKQTLNEESPDKKNEPTRGAFDNRTARSSILLGMALSQVSENPQAAVELASASLQDGISFELQTVLLALQDQSFDLAQTVFRAALARIRQAGLTDPNEVLILHSYLYTPGRVRVTSTGDKPNSFQMAVGREQKKITAAAKLKPELAVEFLRTATDALLRLPLPSATANPQMSARMQFSAINAILGELSRIAPERASALQIRAQNMVADARFSPAPAGRQAEIPAPRAGESPQDYDERRIAALEERAKQETDPLSRDIAFAKAALATSAPAYERGWGLAGQIRDKTLGVAITNWLTYRASLHFINTKAFDKARVELIGKNENLVQRAASLVIGAQKLLADKDQIQARAWLQEASSLLNKADKEEGVLAVSFGIVSTYGSFDRPLALNALENSIKLLNQWPNIPVIEEKAPQAKRFAGLLVSDFTYGTKGFGLAAVAAAFPPEEFEPVLALLQELKYPEIKGQLIIKLCQQHLKAKHQPTSPAAKSVGGPPSSTN